MNKEKYNCSNCDIKMPCIIAKLQNDEEFCLKHYILKSKKR